MNTLLTSRRGRMACLAAVAVAIGSGLLTMSTSSAVAKPTPAAATGTNIHKAPRAAFVVDGVRYAPEQISKFNGRPLYFIVDLAKPDQMIGLHQQDRLRRDGRQQQGDHRRGRHPAGRAVRVALLR